MAQDSFIDYYEVLQISPNARAETVQRVYRLLAQMYHPDNKDTGDQEQFALVLEAYKVLSDPERRAAYDVEHGLARGVRWRIIDQAGAVQGFEAERRKRTAILSLLYSKRIVDPDRPALNIIELENLLGVAREHLELSLWYLRESGRITRTDNGRFALTIKGMETLEEIGDSPTPVTRMLTAGDGHGGNGSAA
ncbi:MAG: J domain-containing protein [Acidobacteria bacterium]|nr:J domain-containing protein [Acidobacteriota bacterium]